MSKRDDNKNKERCKRWREGFKEDPLKLKSFKMKNKVRMQETRKKWKALAAKNEKLIEEKREKDRIRKRKSREKKLQMENKFKKQNMPYKCNETLAKALKKVENALPIDLPKKIQVLEVLAKKYRQPTELSLSFELKGEMQMAEDNFKPTFECQF